FSLFFLLLLFLLPPPPPSTLFPTRRSSDLPRLASGRNAHPGPALGANPPFAGQERLDVEFMSVRTMKLDSHRYERLAGPSVRAPDRKSTRLNSSHQIISYAVFCLKKKTLSQ